MNSKQKTITQLINELRSMKVPHLVARYEEVFGKAPRIKHREWLWKRIAWKIQEQRFGGLSGAAQRRLEALMAEIELPIDENRRAVTGKRRAPRGTGEPAVGTTLTRVWKGEEYRARVLERGFEYEGTVYRSLSAVAKAITGTHWNGPLFWGLKKRSRK